MGTFVEVRVTPEAVVKKKIRKIVESHGGYIASAMGTMYGKSGLPDFFAVVNGRAIAIEAKATARSKVTALQIKTLEDIRAAGGRAVVIHADNLDELEDLIQMIINRPW